MSGAQQAVRVVRTLMAVSSRARHRSPGAFLYVTVLVLTIKHLTDLEYYLGERRAGFDLDREHTFAALARATAPVEVLIEIERSLLGESAVVGTMASVLDSTFDDDVRQLIAAVQSFVLDDVTLVVHILDELIDETRDFATEQAPTDVRVANLMAYLADPQDNDRVHDPAAGFAITLAEANTSANVRAVAADISPIARAVGTLNLRLRNVDVSYELHDAVTEPMLEKNGLATFDRVICVPPTGIKPTSRQAAVLQDDPFHRTGLKRKPQTLDTFFVEHALAITRSGGRAVVAIPDSLLMRESYRSWWDTIAPRVDGIVLLPRLSNARTTFRPALLSLVDPSTTTDGCWLARVDSMPPSADPFRAAMDLRPLIDEHRATRHSHPLAAIGTSTPRLARKQFSPDRHAGLISRIATLEQERQRLAHRMDELLEEVRH